MTTTFADLNYVTFSLRVCEEQGVLYAHRHRSYRLLARYYGVWRKRDLYWGSKMARTRQMRK